MLLKDILFIFKYKTLIDLSRYKHIIKERVSKCPLYIFFNLLTTHDPYIPLKKLFKSFNISIDEFKEIKDILINPLRFQYDVDLKSKHLSNKQVSAIKKLYNSCVLSADIMVQKIFSILDDLNLLENTYIIIASDHGEHLGDSSDHYLWEHSTYLSLYESVIKVPLIIYQKKFKKKVVKQQAEIIFKGFVDHTEIPEYLRRSKILAAPSRSEFHAVVPLETMACGVPVVAFRVAGMKDSIEHDKSGWLLEPTMQKPWVKFLNKFFLIMKS